MVISIASQKGGTGKTTTSISLAAGLARRGDRVLLIDIDSQANSSKVLIPNYPEVRKEDTVYSTIMERKPLPVAHTAVEHLDIVGSTILLSNTDVELTTAKDHREARLRRELDLIKDGYDHVIIDCPPTLSWLTLNAFTASDWVIVVVSPGYFELDSITQITKTIYEVQDFFNPHLKLRGYLFTMSDSTVNTRTSLELMRSNYSEAVLRTIIPRNTDIRDAHFSQKDIFSYAPQSTSAQAYRKLIQELFP